MKKLFISYAREDRGRIEPLVSLLRDEGFEVFWDTSIPSGVEWPEFLEAELGSAHALLVLWTPDSVASRWVRTEAHEALLQGKLMPVSLDDVRPPFAFRQIHAFDLIGWRGDRSDSRLATLLAQLRARPEARQSAATASGDDDDADRPEPPRPQPPAQHAAKVSWQRWLAAGGVALALAVGGLWSWPWLGVAPEPAPASAVPPVRPAAVDDAAPVRVEPAPPTPRQRAVDNKQRCDAINQQLAMGLPVPEADRAFLRNGCR